jgi:plastocyanin
MRAIAFAAMLATLIGCQSSTGPTVAATVTIAEYSFTADTVTIPAGEAVRWANAGTVAHTVTSDSGAFASGQLAQPGMDPYGGMTAGATYQRSFAKAGKFPYHCSNHPTLMKGVVIVTP